MARPGQPAKIARNQELIRIRVRTGVSFEKIGRMFGISKQAACFIYYRDRAEKPPAQHEGVLSIR